MSKSSAQVGLESNSPPKDTDIAVAADPVSIKIVPAAFCPALLVQVEDVPFLPEPACQKAKAIPEIVTDKRVALAAVK